MVTLGGAITVPRAFFAREKKQIEYGTGGGIVWDSTGADEYDEALLKARVITERPKEFSLIETMLWTPEEGFFLYEKHIARIADSADYFGFAFSRERLESCLAVMALRFSSPKRVRVLLGRRGDLSGEAKDFSVSNSRVFNALLAEKSIDSQDPFLFHKTSQREVYEDALKLAPGCDDVLLFNERDELTEFTIGNLVVDMDGELLTPPLECGLLAGTFRAHLLETNQVSKQVIMKGDLAKCRKIFLVNSVRKWVAVEIKKG